MAVRGPRAPENLDNHRNVVYGEDAPPPVPNLNWLLEAGLLGNTPTPGFGVGAPERHIMGCFASWGGTLMAPTGKKGLAKNP